MAAAPRRGGGELGKKPVRVHCSGSRAPRTRMLRAPLLVGWAWASSFFRPTNHVLGFMYLKRTINYLVNFKSHLNFLIDPVYSFKTVSIISHLEVVFRFPQKKKWFLGGFIIL
jgi:hypothetical protein